jgi:hypothetical protein
MDKLQSFRKHLQDSMPLTDDGTEAFYDMKFTIDFNGKAVAISNCAAVYNGMLELIDELIDEQ